MQFLATFKMKPSIPAERLGSLLSPEAAKAWELMRADVVRSLWYLPPDPAIGPHKASGAVLLLECRDRAEADGYLRQFPLVQNELVDVEVLDLVPCFAYEALFAERPA